MRLSHQSVESLPFGKGKDSIWFPYTVGSDSRQEVSSKKTSRKQQARCFSFAVKQGYISQGVKVFDLGCGHDNSLNRAIVEAAGGTYLCCDLYNMSIEENIASLLVALEHGVDLVIISNVLNVIKEPEVRKTILLQAKELIGGCGALLIGVYEGVPLAAEKKLGLKPSSKLCPISTRDGWQNRMKTAEYLTEIRNEFESAKIVYGKSKSDLYIHSGIDLELNRAA